MTSIWDGTPHDVGNTQKFLELNLLEYLAGDDLNSFVQIVKIVNQFLTSPEQRDSL
jgi:hypothetical protein